MLSEIHGKSPSDLNNLEDVLTGNFFGAIRYTRSFGSILHRLLSKVEFDAGDKTQCLLASMDENEAFNVRFWPSDEQEGEIDLLIEFPESKSVVGIEIKYHSGLSSEDQLVRYARFVAKYGRFERRYLVFWAKEPDAQIIFNTQKANLSSIGGLNGFGFFSWQKAVETLKDNKTLTGPDKVIQDDLITYLVRKGLDGYTFFPDIQSPVIDPEGKYVFQIPEEGIDFSTISSKFIITSEHYVFT